MSKPALIRAEVPADTETPLSAFMKIAHGESHAFLFESVEGGERIGRWSFLGARPRETFEWRTGRRPDPLEWLKKALARNRGRSVPGLPRFSGGIVGWLGYDAVPLLEPRVRLAGPDELGFPAACLMDFNTVIAFDGLEHRAHVIAEVRGSREEAAARVEAVLERLQGPIPSWPGGGTAGPLKPRVTRRRFEASVAKAREYIRAGDCQQIVISQRFDAKASLPPLSIYRALRRVNPSPYLFYVQADQHALVGSSPEALVTLDRGEVRIRPIAGTRRRGTDAREDAALEAELRANEKENAEHVMLVDLGRNDVGRVSRVGSVRVSAYKAVERYSHVMHLVSEVRGDLAPGLGPVDVLKAAFPAGTVTGAPKVRAMEIIDALEPARRGPYAGAVGWFDRLGNMETCIAIRTLTCRPGRVSTQAGAGVVFDSKPAAEYEETLHKSRAVALALEEAARGAR